MATEPVPAESTILGLPADPEAVRQYKLLDNDQRLLFHRILKDACAVASENDADLQLAWRADEELPDWQTFVIAAVTAPERESKLWDSLAEAIDRTLRPPDDPARRSLLLQLTIDVDTFPEAA